MRRIFTLLLGVLFLVGCGSSQPKVSLAGKYKFEGIEYAHVAAPRADKISLSKSKNGREKI